MDAIVTWLTIGLGLIGEGRAHGGAHLLIDGFFGLWILLMPLVIIGSLIATIVREVRS